MCKDVNVLLYSTPQETLIVSYLCNQWVVTEWSWGGETNHIGLLMSAMGTEKDEIGIHATLLAFLDQDPSKALTDEQF